MSWLRRCEGLKGGGVQPGLSRQGRTEKSWEETEPKIQGALNPHFAPTVDERRAG